MCARPLAFGAVEQRGAGTTAPHTGAVAALVIVVAAVLVVGVVTGFGGEHPGRVAGGVAAPPSTLRPEPATAPSSTRPSTASSESRSISTPTPAILALDP